MCDVQALRCIDDSVEVSFTINPAVRRIRFHGSWQELGGSREQLVRDLSKIYFSSLSELGDFVHHLIEESVRHAGVSRQGSPSRFELQVSEGQKWRLLAPAVHAVARLVPDPAGTSEITLELQDGFTVPSETRVRPGTVTFNVLNRTNEPELLFSVLGMPADAEHPADDEEEDEEGATEEEPAPPPAFLSGKQLLSTQSFRELFRAETLSSDASLEIRNLAFLFTDLKASTQLYDRVGDLKALALVRDHFQILRDVVARRGGAVVKTIGDAVMATFVDSTQALAAGVEMHRQLRQVTGPDELELKVGVHSGPCVAIDSNERLDYFGQTVNIAARVQALADGRELVCTDAVYCEPGVAEALRALKVSVRPEEVHLKGVSQAVTVHRALVE
jgi:class 3 adenylate cyclase